MINVNEQLIQACGGGNPEKVAFLLSDKASGGTIDIHYCYDAAFQAACYRGHLMFYGF